MGVKPDDPSDPVVISRAGQGSRRSMQSAISLDRIDIELLGHLQVNGRISKSELAAKIGLSNSSCLERMRKLEESGVLKSYHAKIDYSLFQDFITFFTTIILRTHRHIDFGTFEQYIRKVPAVIECCALGGGIDYIMKSSTSSVGSYQEMIDKMLDSELGIDRYYTYVVTKSVKYSDQMPISRILDKRA